MIGSKNHRPSGVDEVRVSEGSRSMARPATLKFADIDQEMEFLVQQKIDVQKELTAIREQYAVDMKEVSSTSRKSTDYWARKAALDDQQATRKGGATRRLHEIESQLASAKLRKKQELARMANFSGDTKQETGDFQTGLRADGSVDLGVTVQILIREIRGLREDIRQFIQSK